ncbi:unnamed protein product, partial [Medioppia subpectinata]
MCSETLIQDYHNRAGDGGGHHVLHHHNTSNGGNHLAIYSSQHPMMSNGVGGGGGANSPMNTMNTMGGESNIYMEPSLANGGNNTYQCPTDNHYNTLTSHYNHCQSPQPPGLPTAPAATVNGTTPGVGSVPASPHSSQSPPTPPSTNGPLLPPYLTDSLSSHSHHNHHHNNHCHTSNDQQIPQQPYYHHLHDQLFAQTEEFLPLCDLLFNIISLAAYFCDVVFDAITAYTLYLEQDFQWLSVTAGLILFSALVSQALSYRWYRRKRRGKQLSGGGNSVTGDDDESHCQSVSVFTVHLFLCGVLWRYFKLFIPVDLSSVKHEVRDLCLLRMVHAFCEAAPMLTIQVYLLWVKTPTNDQNSDLHYISIFLSLFSLCWALASFSKNVRQHNIHKLVLTWLGVIFQFFWRLGTIGSRVIALTVYATFYGHWIFAVIILHWFSMFLWLLSPKNLFYGEQMSSLRRMCYSSLIAWVYIFCYINMQEDNSRNRMIAFYSTMFLENSLLLGICLTLSGNDPSVGPLFTSAMKSMSVGIG